MQTPYLRNLIPYFKHYPLPMMKTTFAHHPDDLKKWRSLPLSYLSDREKIQLALVLMSEGGNEHEKVHHKCLTLLEYVEAKGTESLQALSSQLLGVLHFEKALYGPYSSNSKAHLRLAYTYFRQAAKSNELYLIAKLHEVLVLVARDRLPEAIKLLHHLSKTPPELALTIYQTLENIYRAIGLEQTSKFYQLKRIKKRYPLCLEHTRPFSNPLKSSTVAA